MAGAALARRHPGCSRSNNHCQYFLACRTGLRQEDELGRSIYVSWGNLGDGKDVMLENILNKHIH